MWFRSVFLKTLRDHRVAILGWGLGMGALAPIVFVGVTKVLLNSPDATNELLALTRNPALRVFAEPVDVFTPGGYATWRLSMVLPLVAIWALLIVSRTVRGEEEHGGLDTLLSVPRSRLRVAMEKLTAVAASLLLIGLLMSVLAFAGAMAIGLHLAVGRALLFGLNTSLFALVFGAIALVVSQFTSEARTAAGITGSLLGLSFVLTSASRVVPGGEWIGPLSPLHFFERNKPLVAGSEVHSGPMIVMAGLAGVLMALGVVLFTRRDIGAPVALPRLPRSERRRHELPLRAWSLKSVVARNVSTAARSALWWGVAVGSYTMMLTALLRQLQRNLDDLVGDLARSNPLYATLIASVTRGGNVTVNMALLNLVFTQLVVMVAAFAITTANRWASDEESGRLELVLALPKPRRRVMLAHFAATTLAVTILAASIFAGATIAAALVGMQLHTSRVAQAAIGMVPVGLVVAAAGYLFSSWLQTRAVTGTLIALVLASFLITLLARLFQWPDAVLQLSMFEHYGAPLVDGLRLPRVLGLFGVAGATLSAATVRFARKDISG
jgi:polyether ionophore transport system permease protein